MPKRLFPVLILLASLLGAPTALAQAAGTPQATAAAPTQKQALQALEVLQDPKKREQLIDTLQAIAKAAPPPPPATAPALAPNSLGAQLLVQLSGWLDRLSAEASATAKSVTSFPLFWRWLRRLARDPTQLADLFGATWRVALVLVAGLLAEFLVLSLLRRPASALERHAPEAEGEAESAPGTTDAPPSSGEPPNPAEIMAPPPADSATGGGGAGKLLRRLPFALARLVLDLVPIAVFAALANFLATPLTPTLTARLVALALIGAYAIDRVILCVGRMLAAPHSRRLRLLPIGDASAAYLTRWLKVIAGIAVFGSAVAEISVLLGAEDTMHDTMLRLVALIVALLLVMLVTESRAAVAQRIRPATAPHSGWDRWRLWLAGAWHYLAVIVILLGWVAWAAGVRNGAGGLRYLIGTASVLIVARVVAIIALGSLDRIVHVGERGTGHPVIDERAVRYYPPARVIIIAIIAGLTAVFLLQVWGLDAFAWFRDGGIGGRLLSALITIAIAAACALVVWETANAAIDRRLARLSAASTVSRAARLRTLLPILRAALLTVILAVVGLTALSEVGINIAPLLAGAGIAGVAVGFGSQKLVQDVITGVFVLIENAIQVGDVVTVAGLSGTVEQLSVRNIWLRANEGSVHVIPFSAVTTITNSSRGIGNAAILVTVAYKEDIDQVTRILGDVADEMRKDPKFAPLMLGDLQVLGVDTVKASGVTVAAQIVCTDGGRLPVQREFNRRMKRRFQELDIELAA